jgi:hypothetical protein
LTIRMRSNPSNSVDSTTGHWPFSFCDGIGSLRLDLVEARPEAGQCSRPPFPASAKQLVRLWRPARPATRAEFLTIRDTVVLERMRRTSLARRASQRSHLSPHGVRGRTVPGPQSVASEQTIRHWPRAAACWRDSERPLRAIAGIAHETPINSRRSFQPCAAILARHNATLCVP